MSLEKWLENGWLTPHQAGAGEIDDLLAGAGSDLADAKRDISPAWRFAIAYNAALRLCTAVLAASGYRATREQKHYRSIAALPFVLGPDTRELSEFLDRCRTKRHDVTYESSAAVTHSEAEELILAAEELLERVRRWLTSRSPRIGD